ncbi:hypothetical protein [Micromonospora haikouensis]|uniref:hypothetical protein n=1 Tax=Micromonospora haikouensis TaxID=686309 RepID=UPI003D727C00
MIERTAGLLAIALLGCTAALAPAGAAMARTAEPASARPTGTATVSVGRLILDPTERGYRGSLPVTITNPGPAADHFWFQVREPVPSSFADSLQCDYADPVDNHEVRICAVPGDGGDLAPGESRSFSVGFHVLATPRAYPMSATGGVLDVFSAAGASVSTPFGAQFRSTTGSLTRPRPVPYVQDARPDAAIDVTGPVTVDPYGSYRLPVRVRYAGDAPHSSLYLKATNLPAGVVIEGTDPTSGPAYSDETLVPGTRMMPGEERAFDVVFSAPTSARDVTLELWTAWFGVSPDATPGDNVATFTLAPQ